MQAILDEAAEKGPADINIKEVARRAMVSVGSLYQYFGSRENLLAFAVELGVRMMTDLFTMSRPYLLEMSLREALTDYLTYGLEWSRTQQGIVQFFGRAAYQGDPQIWSRRLSARWLLQCVRSCSICFPLQRNAANCAPTGCGSRGACGQRVNHRCW